MLRIILTKELKDLFYIVTSHIVQWRKIKHLRGILPIEVGECNYERLNVARRHEEREQAMQIAGERIFQTKGRTSVETLSGNMLDASKGKQGRQCG